MNIEWSNQFKTIQKEIGKESTFPHAIELLLLLRNIMYDELIRLKNTLELDEFCAIPFINQTGYHSKTIAYSIWHIFRIEDIVINTLVKKDTQVFFSGKYQNLINSPIITTGNELIKEEIASFSKQLNIDYLFDYISNVKNNTDAFLKALSYQDLKLIMISSDKSNLLSLNVVSPSELSLWLIDYWCGKDIKGLILMPLSRHWIMHIEAMKRIENKLISKKSSSYYN